MSDFAEEVGGNSNGAGGARAVANRAATVGCGTCPAELLGPSETARLAAVMSTPHCWVISMAAVTDAC